MQESLGFKFNGKHSSEFGVVLAHTSGSLYQEQSTMKFQSEIMTNSFTGDTVVEKDKKEPYKFKFIIFLEKWKERNNYRDIMRWLNTEGFEELSFDSHPDKLVFAKVTEFNDLNHNGNMQGYFEVEFTANSAMIYSQQKTTDEVVVNGSHTFEIYNEGDSYCYPSVWIEKLGTGSISIQVNEEKPLEIEKINNKEKVFIDNRRRFILSSQEEVGVYRANDHNHVWIKVPPSYLNTNEDRKHELITVRGNCRIQLKWFEEYYSLY